MFYTIQRPESRSSQIVHRTTLPTKLGCGMRCVSLRFDIIVLYMVIYVLSTEAGQQKTGSGPVLLCYFCARISLIRPSLKAYLNLK